MILAVVALAVAVTLRFPAAAAESAPPASATKAPIPVAAGNTSTVSANTPPIPTTAPGARVREVSLAAAPIEGKAAPPPPRKRAEFDAVLKDITTELPVRSVPGAPLPTFNILLCDGPKDHGIGEHDYPQWRRRWSILLALAEGVVVDTAHIWPRPEQFARAQVICFFNNNPDWNEDHGRELDTYLANGGGAVYFHWALEGRASAPEFARRIGLASNTKLTKYRHGPVDLVFHSHPLARGFRPADFTRENFIDETYWDLIGDPGAVQLVASAEEDGALRPQIWTRTVGRGRVFVSIPGHYNWTFDDPVYRLLAFRGICWAAGQREDRLIGLATIGARIDSP